MHRTRQSVSPRYGSGRAKPLRECRGNFSQLDGRNIHPCQIRGEILYPEILFTAKPEIAIRLTVEGYPLHVIGKISDPTVFLGAIRAGRASSKHGWQVSEYSEAEYAAMRLFLSMDGGAGFAIKDDGDLVSVFGNRQIDPRKQKIPLLLLLAVEQGAQKADCFDGYLPELYSRFGFHPVCRLPWNPEMKPKDWPEGGDRPNVIFLAYQGGPRHTLVNRIRTFAAYEPETVPYAASYEEALQRQAAAVSQASSALYGSEVEMLHAGQKRPNG